MDRVASGEFPQPVAIRSNLREALQELISTNEFGLNQYVPAHWLSGDHAIALFSTAVYLQLLHYVAVIYVLPRLGAKSGEAACKSIVRWPSPGKYAAFVAAAGAIACTAFWTSFADARAFYSLAAAVHAWIEIPLLLLAVVPATVALESAPSLP